MLSPIHIKIDTETETKRYKQSLIFCLLSVRVRVRVLIYRSTHRFLAHSKKIMKFLDRSIFKNLKRIMVRDGMCEVSVDA